MNIDYKATGLALTDEIRAYAEEKVRAVHTLVSRANDVRYDVEIARESAHHSGEVCRADITVHADGERTHAVGHGETVFGALDEAKDELKRRLRRSKSRKISRMRAGAAAIKKMLRFWES